MGKNSYVVESDFDDLHGNPDDDGSDIELDLDSKNPIVQAALGNEDWTPPEEDEKDKDDEDDDELEELDDDGDDDDPDEDDDLDEDEDESEDEDEEEDDDDEKNSKKVQKRIDRERNLRRSDQLRSDARIAKMEKRLELRDAKDEFRTEQEDADKALRKLKKQKIDAIEEGETSQVVEIDDKILDIKADRKAAQLELKRRTIELEKDDGGPDTTGIVEEGRKWIEKYPQFNTNRQFNAVALQADKMCAARNLDKNTPEYYEEMEKILQPQFPEIIKTAKKTTKRKKNADTARKKRRSAVGSTTKAGTRKTSPRKRGRRVIRLTKKDQENMEIFGLDPSDPEQVKAWAENKQD